MAGVEALRRRPGQRPRRRGRLLRLLLDLPGGRRSPSPSAASCCATGPSCSTNVRQYVDQTLPGFVKTSRPSRGSSPSAIPEKNALTITGLIGVVGLVLAGLGWLSALRDGIRAVFGVPGEPGNPITAQAARPRRDGAPRAGRARLGGRDRRRPAGSPTTVSRGHRPGVADLDRRRRRRSSSGVVLDTALVALMLRVLSGVAMPWRALRNGAVFGGVGLTILKVAGSRLIAGTTNNKLFASFALVVGLLVWLNLISRVMLVAAAWAANDVDPAPTASPTAQRRQAVGGPGPRAAGQHPRAHRRRVCRPSASGPRTGRRVAAGAVLGAVGAVAVGSLGRGIRASSAAADRAGPVRPVLGGRSGPGSDVRTQAWADVVGADGPTGLAGGAGSARRPRSCREG